MLLLLIRLRNTTPFLPVYHLQELTLHQTYSPPLKLSKHVPTARQNLIFPLPTTKRTFTFQKKTQSLPHNTHKPDPPLENHLKILIQIKKTKPNPYARPMPFRCYRCGVQGHRSNECLERSKPLGYIGELKDDASPDIFQPEDFEDFKQGEG